MLNRLLDAIRKALRPRWEARLPTMLADAERLEAGVSPEEAYQEGYRKAYWDAVVDMAEADLLRHPDDPLHALAPKAPVIVHASDEIH
jgi:hypothetical protein